MAVTQSKTVLSLGRMSGVCVPCITGAGNEGLLSIRSRSAGVCASPSDSGNMLMSGNSMNAGSGLHVEPIRVTDSLSCIHPMRPESAQRQRIGSLTRRIGALFSLIMDCINAITRLVVIPFIFTMGPICRMSWIQWLRGPVTSCGPMCLKPEVRSRAWLSSPSWPFARFGHATQLAGSANKDWLMSMGLIRARLALLSGDRPGVTWSNS